MKLAPHEYESAPVRKMRAHLEKTLDEYRKQNDGVLDAEQTARLRGKIAATKAFLALVTSPEPMGSDG